MSTTINTTYTKAVRVGVSTTGGAPLLPTPNMLATGSTTSAGSSTLIDSTKDFIARGVKAGDVVFNLQTGAVCYVTSVTNATTIAVGAPNFNASAVGYIIYSQSDAGTVQAYNGAVLYNSGTATSGLVTVISMDGITMNVNIPAGGICPFQVSQVTACTGWGNVIALW